MEADNDDYEEIEDATYQMQDNDGADFDMFHSGMESKEIFILCCSNKNGLSQIFSIDEIFIFDVFKISHIFLKF